MFGFYKPCTDAVFVQADEAYLVGKGLTPVAAYLAQDVRKYQKLSFKAEIFRQDIIRIALENGVDMIHPG